MSEHRKPLALDDDGLASVTGGVGEPSTPTGDVIIDGGGGFGISLIGFPDSQQGADDDGDGTTTDGPKKRAYS